jgi:hypothetical protein
MHQQRPNPIAEGFTVASIYAAGAAVIVTAASVSQAGGWGNFYTRADIAGWLGRITGNLVLQGSFLSAVIGYRYASNVLKNIFLDWRFWAVFVIMGVLPFIAGLPINPSLGWVWVNLIYWYRENRRQTRLLQG